MTSFACEGALLKAVHCFKTVYLSKAFWCAQAIGRPRPSLPVATRVIPSFDGTFNVQKLLHAVQRDVAEAFLLRKEIRKKIRFDDCQR